MHSNTLSVVDSYPYLGVTISSDLRWDRHVTVTKATRALNFVRRNISLQMCIHEAKELA